MSLIKDIYKDYESNRLRYSITDKTYLARPKLKQTNIDNTNKERMKYIGYV